MKAYVWKLSLILCLALALHVPNFFGQSCPTIDRDPTKAWPSGKTVTVYLDPAMTLAQQDAAWTAFLHWNNVANSGVTFTLTEDYANADYGVIAGPGVGTRPGTRVTTDVLSDGNNAINAITTINDQVTDLTAFTQCMSNGIGETFGLLNCPTCPSGSTAMKPGTTYNDTTSGRSGPSTCDQNTALLNYPISGGGNCVRQSCDTQNGWYWNWEDCRCEYGPPPPSPVLVDVDGSGFHLTDAEHGVNFDLENQGIPQRVSWTALGSTNAFLVLDRNNDGRINNGSELFGNFTSQPNPPAGQSKNGFLALAEYDKPAHGGNGNGRIDRRDAIFPSLRLWQDTNHNGVADAGELRTLAEFGIYAIDLNYHESRRTDQFGNQFRYRARVLDAHDAQVGRWAWDVFFTIQPD